MSAIFSNNSEANVSELLENLGRNVEHGSWLVKG